MKHAFRSLSKTLSLLLIGSISACAQLQLIVTTNDGLSETFLLEQLRSIAFNGNNMNINRIDGVVFTWDIDNIDNYHFAGTLDTPEAPAALDNRFVVFPNPIRENVSVSYNSQKNEFVTIELLNLVGQQVQLFYSGNHQGFRRYTWGITVPSGVYMCRIKTENEEVSKTVIVQ
jgi:hypothetical protein